MPSIPRRTRSRPIAGFTKTKAALPWKTLGVDAALDKINDFHTHTDGKNPSAARAIEKRLEEAGWTR